MSALYWIQERFWLAVMDFAIRRGGFETDNELLNLATSRATLAALKRARFL